MAEESQEEKTKTKDQETVIEETSAEDLLKEEKEKNLRLLAEMENLRKRLHKEKLEMNRFAVENILLEFLTPVDNLENALGFSDNMSEETKNWAIGFEMILTQLKDIFSHYNVKPSLSMGQQFDPHKHEAVEVEETDEIPEGTITHEFLRGFQCGDRTIRAARVRVAKPLAKVTEEKKQKDEESKNG